jgi:hypothetical protein
MTSRYSLREKLIFDPSHPKLPRNAVFEIHEVTPDGRQHVKETFHDAGQATRALERLRTKEQLRAKEQQP